MRNDIPLDDDLLPYYEPHALNGMGSLRHPLVYQVPFRANGLANEQLRMKKAQLESAVKAKNWSQVVWLHERPYRVDALWEIRRHLPDAEYWKIVGSAWVDTENAWANLDKWRALFGSPRPKRENLMDWDEQMAYESLAPVVTIYRGCQQGLNEDGLSWTLNKSVAERFANRLNKDGIVLEREVEKSDIIAVFTGRNEFEVIIGTTKGEK